jgi:hypothetical protein
MRRVADFLRERRRCRLEAGGIAFEESPRRPMSNGPVVHLSVAETLRLRCRERVTRASAVQKTATDNA